MNGSSVLRAVLYFVLGLLFAHAGVVAGESHNHSLAYLGGLMTVLCSLSFLVELFKSKGG